MNAVEQKMWRLIFVESPPPRVQDTLAAWHAHINEDHILWNKPDEYLSPLFVVEVCKNYLHMKRNSINSSQGVTSNAAT